MPLSPGTRLGSYEIAGELGAGGMGEVYRARDTRLHREVAIKIVPASVAGDADRLARFAREAQVLASLNHPGIAQIYGLVDVPAHSDIAAGHASALAMELVEGEDLAARIARGPLPFDEALAIARQIAEALEYAHERGIIHRDLKPANIKVLPDGAVKVLDFGLAKAVDPAASGIAPVSGATITTPAVTNVGVILGTAAYMSPEQARGKPVDRRADIWALGAVFFEMLSGRRTYDGETVTETIAKVITETPDWDLLPTATPAAIRRLLRRCLQKDPRSRFQAAGDVRLEIDEYLAAPQADAAAAAPSKSRTARMLPWAIAAAAMLISALAIWSPWRPPADEPSTIRLDVRLGAGEALAVDNDNDGALAVLSPDGRTLVYAGTQDSVRRLYLRRLDTLDSTPLSGTEGALSHFFSPDGRWVGFFANGMLKKVATSGGAPVAIAPAANGRGGTWAADDTIVFAPGTTSGLQRVSAAGGTPVDITMMQANERSHRWPAFLPDGGAVLFIRQDENTSYDDGVIEAVRPDTKERKILVRGGTFPQYLSSGHLVYVRENTLFAVPFDAQRLEVTGSPQAVVSGVLASRGTGGGFGDGAAQVAFSTNGTMAYIAGSSPSQFSRLVIVNRSGQPVYRHAEAREFRDPRFSPDGSRVALQASEGNSYHIYILDPDRATMTRVTFDGTTNGFPLWSPDGTRLAYFSDRLRGGLNIFLGRSDGTGEPEMLTTGTSVFVPTSFSPDGRLIAGMEQASSNMFDVFVLSVSDKRLTPFAATPAAELMPEFSPTGKWIAYQSNESGAHDVYVRAYPGPGGKVQISSGGGAMPVWTKQGRELIYIGGPTSNRLMAVSVDVRGGTLQAGKPQVLFEIPVARPSNARWYDVTRDGDRFAVLVAEDETSIARRTHVTLVFNLFDDLRRLAQ